MSEGEKGENKTAAKFPCIQYCNNIQFYLWLRTREEEWSEPEGGLQMRHVATAAVHTLCGRMMPRHIAGWLRLYSWHSPVSVNWTKVTTYNQYASCQIVNLAYYNKFIISHINMTPIPQRCWSYTPGTTELEFRWLNGQCICTWKFLLCLLWFVKLSLNCRNSKK